MYNLKYKKDLFFCRLLCHMRQGASGIGVIEVILILVVLIGLIIIFKQQLTSIMNSLFKNIKADIKTI